MPQPKKKSLQAPSAQRGAAPESASTAQQPVAPATPHVFSRPAELSWTYNPWTDSGMRGWRRPWLALLACVCFAAVSGFGLTWPHWWPDILAWGGLGLIALLGMCATLFLPVSYKLDNRGVTVSFLLAPSFRPWEYYRNFYVHDTVVHLTTMPQPSPLDAFRGHPLQYGRLQGRREEVVAFIRQRIPPTADSPPSGRVSPPFG